MQSRRGSTPTERVITIEDAAELRLRQPHVVRLESRPPSVEGRGEVTIRDLLRNALRMRPDRIVIGEVRGPEALDLLTALNTGHGGALSTLHANSPDDALGRLETLALMAGVGLPHAAIREQVARGFDVIAHVQREPDGTRGSARCRRSRGATTGGRAGALARLSPAVMLAALAGGLAAVAARDALRVTPRAAAWLARAVEPARPRGKRGLRADRCGAPAARAGDRSAALLGGGAWLLGPAPAAPLAAAGPAAASWAVAARAKRYRGAVERALPRVAVATADALAAGRSVRSALEASSGAFAGPAAAEMARVRADLDLGLSLDAALGGLRSRMGSPRVDSFCSALLSQRITGGDLVGLLRRYAEAAAGPRADRGQRAHGHRASSIHRDPGCRDAGGRSASGRTPQPWVRERDAAQWRLACPPRPCGCSFRSRALPRSRASAESRAPA